MSAQPLAQDYVEVTRTPSPALRTDDCALTRPPGGGLLASTRRSRQAGGTPQWNFKLARSRDGGQTWESLPALDLVRFHRVKNFRDLAPNLRPGM